jgi:hypothetical protein
VRCGSCKHEFLLAFSCQCRYFCPTCHAKRLAQWGIWLQGSLLAEVPHRQVVLAASPPPANQRSSFKVTARRAGPRPAPVPYFLLYASHPLAPPHWCPSSTRFRSGSCRTYGSYPLRWS